MLGYPSLSVASHALFRWMAVGWGCALIGCSALDVNNSPLRPARAAPDTVGLEITTARFPLDDPDVNGPLWNEIDEQHFSSELRQRLLVNGFRVGVTGTRLPPSLEKLLAIEGDPTTTDNNTHIVEFAKDESNVRQRLVRVAVGRRTHVICTGEAKRHDSLSVLIRGEDGRVNGRTFQKVMGILAVKAFPQPDGHVKVELSPEVEHGDPQRRFDPSEGVLRVEFGPPREAFDLLRMTAELSPGQYLVIGTSAARSGTLGYQFFTDSTSDRAEQKLMLLRIVHTPPEPLFDELSASR